MSTDISRKIFTFILDGTSEEKSLTITADDSIARISIYNNSDTAGTVQGNKTTGGEDSIALTIGAGVTQTITVDEANIINSLVITAPVGCTLEILAS